MKPAVKQNPKFIMTGKKVFQNGEFAGTWFNPDTAICFNENTYWNGSNQISKATGSQWDHEAMYYTKSGNWIRNTWSQYQNSVERHDLVSEGEAAEWFIKNEYESDQLKELPEAVLKLITEHIEGREV